MCGLEAEFVLGISIAFTILLHDIPEGITMAIPLRKGGISRRKIIMYIFLSGLATGIGCFIGTLFGNINKKFIGISMAIAGGAMAYVVAKEIFPQIDYKKSNINKILFFISLLIGIIVCVYV